MSAQQIDIDKVFDEMTPILDAFQRAFESVVHEHAWRGLPIVGWRDGKVTFTDANSYYLDGTVPLPAHLTTSLSTPTFPAVTEQVPMP